MKRVLLTFWIILLVVTVSAQDFASRFMAEHKADVNLTCISISPRMMEEVLKVNVEEDGDKIMDIISNLKSMQMVTSEKDGAGYFKRALNILNKNSNRFESFLSFNDSSENYRMMVRRKNGIILELVMLKNDNNRFVVINFTGNMSDKFIDKVANSMNMKRAQKK